MPKTTTPKPLYSPRTPSCATTPRAVSHAPCTRPQLGAPHPLAQGLRGLAAGRCNGAGSRIGCHPLDSPALQARSAPLPLPRRCCPCAAPAPTRRPLCEPSRAICRVLITDSGYRHVVRPCASTGTVSGGSSIKAAQLPRLYAGAGRRITGHVARGQAAAAAAEAHREQAGAHHKEFLLVQPAHSGMRDEVVYACL